MKSSNSNDIYCKGKVVVGRRKNSNPPVPPPFDLVVHDDDEDNSKEEEEADGMVGSSSLSTTSKGGEVPSRSTPTSTSSSSSFDRTFEGVARLLRGRKNIVVLVGAGISTSCGIPDFRGKDSGLYNTLDVGALGLSCPEDLFCYDFFQDNPYPFYQFAQKLYYPLGLDKKVEPSDSHKLLALLEQKKMLLRVYSQNIDGLEAVAGVSSKKIVYAHGSLRWAKCLRCSKKVTCDDILPAIATGSVPRCKAPLQRKSSNNSNISSSSTSPFGVTVSPRTPSQRNKKRPLGDSSSTTPSSQRRILFPTGTNGENNDDDNNNISGNDSFNNNNNNDDDQNRRSNYFLCNGVYKPGVTFFGEALDDSVRRALESDRDKVDALIVIGTSLSVAPISKVVEYLPPNIPRILINQTVVYPLTTTTTTTTTITTTITTTTRRSSTMKGGRGVVEAVMSDNTVDDGDDEIEFRDNYAFDAYLLGFCDDITRALAKQLFDNDNDMHSARNSQRVTTQTERPPIVKKRRTMGGKSTNNGSSTSTTRVGGNADLGAVTLSSVLNGREPSWNADGWSCITVPPERVLLFPGALSTSVNSKNNSDNNNHNNNNSSSTSSEGVVTVQVDYREIAHCDGCSKRIRGVIQKCVICFDYDLCGRCYPILCKTHYDGKHTFCAEEGAL